MLLEPITGFEIETFVDSHVHVREADINTMQPLVVKLVAGGADVIGPMPNTGVGLRTAREVLDYNILVKACVPAFQGSLATIPILLINEETTCDTITECVDNGIVDSKFLPLNRTTKSHNGIRHYGKILTLDKHCGKVGMRRHYHPEHPWMLFDNRDAEFAFLPIVDMLLNESIGQIVWEHGSDARCIPYWEEMAKTGRFFITLTPHHLLTDENNSYGDVRKTFKPPAKTKQGRLQLVDLVTKDYPWVMAGSDFAPHDQASKQVFQGQCSCGAYHGDLILPFYAHALDALVSTKQGRETFINFTSRNARWFYALPKASGRPKLIKDSQTVPLYDEVGPWTVQYFAAGERIDWRLIK